MRRWRSFWPGPRSPCAPSVVAYTHDGEEAQQGRRPEVIHRAWSGARDRSRARAAVPDPQRGRSGQSTVLPRPRPAADSALRQRGSILAGEGPDGRADGGGDGGDRAPHAARSRASYESVFGRVIQGQGEQSLKTTTVSETGRIHEEVRFALRDWLRSEDLFAYGITPSSSPASTPWSSWSR